MSARITDTRPPRRKPDDIGAILMVTAAAYQKVRDRLGAAFTFVALPHHPAGVSQFRVEHAVIHCPLTARELEVLSHAAEGRENAQIAKRLFLSTETVRTHIKSILRKLGAADRTQAVHIAHRHGWLA